MKKLGRLLFIISLGFIMVSCDYFLVNTEDTTATNTSETTETSTITNTVSDAAPTITTTTATFETTVESTINSDDTIIQMLSITYTPTFNFSATFTDIEVDVLFGRVSFTLTINDSNYSNYNYYLIMQDQESNKSTTSLLSVNRKPYSGTFVFNFSDNNRYRVFVGKATIYDSSQRVEGVAAFDFQCPSFELRKHIGIASIYCDTENPYSDVDATRIYTDVQIRVKDPDYAITSMKMLVFTAGTNHLAYEHELEIPSTRDETYGSFTINHIATGLSPSATYTIFIIASGDDGRQEFVEKTIGNTDHTMDKYAYMIEGFDGLYAYFNNIRYEPEGYAFSLHYVNSGNVHISGEDIPFYINIYNTDNELISSELLSIEDQEVLIPYEFLDDQYIIKIENANSSVILTRMPVYAPRPTYEAHVGTVGTLKKLYVTIEENGTHVFDATISVMVGTEIIAVITFNQLSIGETNIFDLDYGQNTSTKVTITVSIEYLFFGTHEGNCGGTSIRY